MTRVILWLHDAVSRAFYMAGSRWTALLAAEPVRVRSFIVAWLIGMSAIVPALADHRLDELIAGVVGSLAAIAAGEDARRSVTPTGK